MERSTTVAPRRAGLVQERSRQTRRRLIRTALDLWSERGFETGIEDTTVEEIAAAAGVTKGTFYFHFARKEQILLEMGFQTADLLHEGAARCLNADMSLPIPCEGSCRSLGVRSLPAPPGAVGRALTEFLRPPPPGINIPGEPTFRGAFELLFDRAQEEGEVTDQVKPWEMANILQALVLDSIMEWSRKGGRGRVTSTLQHRMAILLAGLRPGADLSF